MWHIWWLVVLGLLAGFATTLWIVWHQRGEQEIGVDELRALEPAA